MSMQDTAAMRSCTNAYMLVYIRDSHISKWRIFHLLYVIIPAVGILEEVKDDDISEYLVKRFEEEK